jgi:hypothetical protein
MAEIEIKVKTSELGVVYCLSNPAFSYVKIGKTNGKSAEDRAKELHTTGTPTPFTVLFAKRVINSSLVENEIHEHFKEYRVNKKREFFNVPVNQVLDYFLNIDGFWDPPPSDQTLTGYIPFEDVSLLPVPPVLPTHRLIKSVSSVPNMQPPPPSAPPTREITIMDIHINNMTTEQRDILLQTCMNTWAMELRLIIGYYFFDQINHPQLTSDMRFNAILNSPDMGYIMVSSSNFEEVICEIVRNGPSSFIELDERLDT